MIPTPYFYTFEHKYLRASFVFVQVLENILCSSEERLTKDLVEVLAEKCRDSSLAVKKQMVVSLTELVKTYPDKEELVYIWVDGVFPLILDVEQKAAKKVLECIWECLFGNLVSARKARQCQSRAALDYSLLRGEDTDDQLPLPCMHHLG